MIGRFQAPRYLTSEKLGKKPHKTGCLLRLFRLSWTVSDGSSPACSSSRKNQSLFERLSAKQDRNDDTVLGSSSLSRPDKQQSNTPVLCPSPYLHSTEQRVLDSLIATGTEPTIHFSDVGNALRSHRGDIVLDQS